MKEREKMHSCAIKLKPNPSAKVRLYVIHHAGGSHTLFRPWIPMLPGWIELIALEVPGRGYSFGTPFCKNLREVIDDFFSEIQTDKPFALFGHSMGALIAYEITMKLEGINCNPIWLGLSAYLPPNITNNSDKSRWKYCDAELIHYLSSLGKLSQSDFEDLDKNIKKIMFEIVRSDFQLVDSWHMTESLIPSKVRVHCFSGRNDRVASPIDIAGWASFTTSSFSHTRFDGGHFFLEQHDAELLKSIEKDLHSIIDIELENVS